MRTHHAAAVGPVRSGHQGGRPGDLRRRPRHDQFQVVAQFNNASFSGTVAIADKDIWAVGSSNSTGTNEPLAVHFNGMSWSAVPTPAVKGGSLSGVAAVASHDVWAVGSTGSQSLIEHWDGTSWNVVSSPKLSKGGSLTAVTAISTNNVWAVGLRDDFRGTWSSTGTARAGASSPAPRSPAPATSSEASRPMPATTCGPWGTAPWGAVILHFDGTSWSRGGRPGGGPLAPGGHGALIEQRLGGGDGEDAAQHPKRRVVEQWNGTSWSAVSSPNPNPQGTSLLSGIAAVSAANIYAVGSVIEHSDGTSWSILTTPSGVFGMDGVTALSDGTVVIVSSSGSILEN